MKERITEIVQKYPKHYSRIIQRDLELRQWVNEHSIIESGEFKDHVRSALFNESNICPNGKQKKLRSISDGFVGCGPARVCQCTKDAVSSSIKQTLAGVSIEQQQRINERRAITNLEKYGVENIGQTAKARTNHAAVYTDKNKVAVIREKHSQTVKSRYGVENIWQVPSIVQKRKYTLIERYGVENPMSLATIATRAQTTKQARYAPYYLAKLNFEHFVGMVQERFDSEPLLSSDEYIGVGARPEIDFKCCSCGHVFRKRFDYASPPICKVCHPSEVAFKSKGELEILDFVRSLGIAAISGDRTAINPFEIDVFVPSLKVGIEYCGLYWHSELSGKKSWNYHAKKHQLAQSAGIDIITIYSDEWERSSHAVKAMIQSKLMKNTKKVFARKCSVLEISAKEAKTFLADHHIQGFPKRCPINFALTFDNKLVAVMTFVKKDNTTYELTRYASSVQVVGGASKLISAFAKKYQHTTIESFSNNRFSKGTMYKSLGFQHVGDVPPMQEYVFKYQTRLHKRAIAKIVRDLRASDGLTEWQAAQLLGYDRIWDAGKKKWILNGKAP